MVQKSAGFCIDDSGWIHCPICGCRTRTKVLTETILRNFPIYCPKCKHECLVDIENMNIKISVEPDAKTQSR